MLNVLMLSVAMLNVIMLSVVLHNLRLVYTSDLEVHFGIAFSLYISLPWSGIFHPSENPQLYAF